MAKILYRFSRIAKKPICYNFKDLNCDVVANWLQTGKAQWMTKTSESSKVVGLVGCLTDLFEHDGDISLEILAEVEENSLLSGTD